jgi:folate-binding Fe-S cluster repair protein YgfZ
MLNYESLGGVSFKKGCYTGQEVVARSQFRGTVKRRAFVAWTDGAAQAGQDVVSAADPQQSVGQIAQAAPDPAGGTAVIVVMQQASAQADDLHAAAPDGPALRAPRLPYPLLEEV